MRSTLLAAALAAAFACPAVAEPLRVEIEGTEVRVAGLSADALHDVAEHPPEGKAWQEILRVVAVDVERTDPADAAATAALPALLGRHAIDGQFLRFTPRFPPAPGLVLVARFQGTAWDGAAGLTPGTTADVEARFTVPRNNEGPQAQVLGLTPSGPVPANLLRFYVHFSAPMARHRVLPHVQLLDEAGETVPVAFVEVPGGLWGPESRRLTLFVHPGRIKRGVGPRQVMGPVLEEGKTYRLVVGAEAHDASGRPLAEGFEAKLEVGPEDRTSPDPTTWTLQAPTSPQAPLIVNLPQPADPALLGRLPWVETASKEPVPGQFEARDDGLGLTFTPTNPWASGTYRLVVPPNLEDSAGNRVDRLFEEAPGHGEVGLPVVRSFGVGG